MKLGALVGESVKDLGLRFNLVGILPTLVLFLFILALLASGAPGSVPEICTIVEKAGQLQLNDAVFLIIGVLGFALMLQPLQLKFVRILEGYWGTSWLARFLSRWGIWLQECSRRRLEERRGPMPRILKKGETLSAEEEIRIENAVIELSRFFPEEGPLLPTKLGNVLRSAELSAGEPYGIDTVVIWPRLYPLLSDKVTAVLNDQRNQLDLAVRFCFTFLAAALVSLVVLYRYSWWLLVPLFIFFLVWLSYRAAIEAALAYGEGIKAAVDLHRFDLIKALHLPLPPDIETEKETNALLSILLQRSGIPENFQYDHGDGIIKSGTGSEETGSNPSFLGKALAWMSNVFSGPRK